MKTKKKQRVIDAYGLQTKKHYKLRIGQRMFLDGYWGKLEKIEKKTGFAIMRLDGGEQWSFVPKGFFDGDFILKD